MEPIFTLPYSEYAAIQEIQHYFKKHDGFAVLVPVSRQQKGMDFLILNTKNGKSLKVQVKASRSYTATKAPKRKSKNFFNHAFWFNNFAGRYTKDAADIYVLIGLYPVYAADKGIKTRTEMWRPILLVFTDAEMHQFLLNVKMRKEDKADRFFSLGSNDGHKVFGVRGFKESTDLSSHLLANRAIALLKELA
jgi:hypothetical protein